MFGVIVDIICFPQAFTVLNFKSILNITGKKKAIPKFIYFNYNDTNTVIYLFTHNFNERSVSIIVMEIIV